MRIVFIGASELGYHCCRNIIENGHQLAGILTVGDEFFIKYRDQKERIRVKNYMHKDFTEFKSLYNIPVVVAQKVSDGYKAVEKWEPDLIIVIGWYHMIPNELLQKPAAGVVGIHASLLPRYRGNAPLVWAMINGEKQTGVSLFYIGAGTDEGDIIGQERFAIEETDYISDVLLKTKEASIRMLTEYLPQIEKGSAPRKKQDDQHASYFPKRTPEDGNIDWSWDAYRIYNFVRAQSKPYPGAFFQLYGQRIKVWKCIPYTFEEIYKGRKMATFPQETMLMKCADGLVQLLETSVHENI